MNLNRVIIMGRLCADPDFRQTQSGVPCCRIRLAVNRPTKQGEEQKADFINVSCWRSTAEFVCRFFSKGKMAIVEGCLRNNDYTDQNGVKHYSMADSLRPHGQYVAHRLLCPWDSSGKNTGVGCHSILQGVKNPTANEGDSGSIPGPEPYMPRSRCITTTEPVL